MARGVSSGDTIAAIATPSGRGGIGVIRISGGMVTKIAQSVLGRVPEPRYAMLADFNDADGEPIDTGIALFFPGPASFTGEDVLELQGHGGPVVLDRLLERLVDLGARIALPGEFSERAFLNDKIDLSQAEAIADLIDSVSRQAAKGAVRSLKGEFSARVNALNEKVINLRMYVEAAMDFPEEEIDFLADSRIGEALAEIERDLAGTIEQANQGALLREGLTLVIAGRPNAGKSSLMNRMTGLDTSIVTTVPGTTRDVVREYIHLDGIPLHLIDTAGIRESNDEVEIEGVKRAMREVEKADQVLIVIDAAAHEDSGIDWQEEATALMTAVAEPERATVVLNKRDLVEKCPAVTEEEILVSARTGEGIDELKSIIKRKAGFEASGEGTFIARRRHLEALELALSHVSSGRTQLEESAAGELLAEELRLAHEALCEITGEFTSDDLLGKIFSSFCIGK